MKTQWTIICVSYLAIARLYQAASPVLQCHKLQVAMSADNSFLRCKEQDEKYISSCSFIVVLLTCFCLAGLFVN